MTKDFHSAYERLEAFLSDDPDYARLDCRCKRLQEIVDAQHLRAGQAERDYEAFALCQETLEYAIHDIPDITPDNLALFDGEMLAVKLDIGAKTLECLKRQSMIKGGEASRMWQEASDQLVEVKRDRQSRRLALIDVWDKKLAKEKAAKQEAE